MCRCNVRIGAVQLPVTLSALPPPSLSPSFLPPSSFPPPSLPTSLPPSPPSLLPPSLLPPSSLPLVSAEASSSQTVVGLFATSQSMTSVWVGRWTRPSELCRLSSLVTFMEKVLLVLCGGGVCQQGLMWRWGLSAGVDVGVGSVSRG